MAKTPTIIEWVTIPEWQDGPLPFLSEPGLLRFRQNKRIIFIAYAASPKPGLAGRIAAYRRGDVRSHPASQQIARMKHRLELQVAILQLSRDYIRWLAKDLIRTHNPWLNQKNSYKGRI